MKNILLSFEKSPAFDCPLVLYKEYSLTDPFSGEEVKIELKSILRESRILVFKGDCSQEELSPLGRNAHYLEQIFELEE